MRQSRKQDMMDQFSQDKPVYRTIIAVALSLGKMAPVKPSLNYQLADEYLQQLEDDIKALPDEVEEDVPFFHDPPPPPTKPADKPPMDHPVEAPEDVDENKFKVKPEEPTATPKKKLGSH